MNRMQREPRPAIDYGSPEPIYRQLAAWIQECIDSGQWEHNRRLPSERDLAELWGVSYDTIRRTMALLRGEGYIKSVQGRGTFAQRPGR